MVVNSANGDSVISNRWYIEDNFSNLTSEQFPNKEEDPLKNTKLCLALTAFLLGSSSGAALAVPDDDDAARITTIAGLTNIQQIGSTQNINDANGNAIAANPNPYKVVVVPERLGKLARGTAIDPLVVDAAGNNAALFGVTATEDRKGNLLIFFTDDNTNTLNALSAAPLAKEE
jgi:hypothetical protein